MSSQPTVFATVSVFFVESISPIFPRQNKKEGVKRMSSKCGKGISDGVYDYVKILVGHRAKIRVQKIIRFC